MSSTEKTDGAVYVAWGLGLIALVPFAIGVAGIWAPARGGSDMALAFTIYAAAVLAFLGGVRWGSDLATTQRASLATHLFSILPGVLALTAAGVLPEIGRRWGFVIVAAAFTVQAGWDLNSAAFPPWAGRVRAIVILGGLAATLAALIGS